MRIARLGVLSVALILVVASRGICAAALRAGVARAEITPPAGEQMWGYENRRQTLTVSKGPAANVGHAAGNRDAAQTGAVIERIGSNAGDIGADADVAQAAAEIKRLTTNIGHTGGDRITTGYSAGGLDEHRL